MCSKELAQSLGHSYTYATYGNSGYYDTQVTSYIADSDDYVLDSGTYLGRLNASILLSATGTGCGEYRIVSSHSTVVQYYVTAYFYNNDYRDGYYDLFDYLQFSEQGQSYPLTASFFAPAVSTVRIHDYSEIVLGSTEEISSGNCAPPSVEITPVKAIGKNKTLVVEATVSPSNNKIPITLSLQTNSNTTGQARFVENGSEVSSLTIKNTRDVEIKGITESSTMDNIKLNAKIGTKGAVVTKDNFSVLLVTLTLRTSGNVSPDNSAAGTYETQVNSNKNLGLIQDIILRRCFGVEIVGTVIPNNFDGFIALQRLVLNGKSYLNNVETGSATNQQDTSLGAFRDDDPVGSGKVYDLDAPCPVNQPEEPNQSVKRLRTNFKQWATLEGVKVSDDLNWFVRISSRKTGIGTNEFSYDASPQDNTAGVGTTPLTWNLSNQ